MITTIMYTTILHRKTEIRNSIAFIKCDIKEKVCFIKSMTGDPPKCTILIKYEQIYKFIIIS